MSAMIGNPLLLPDEGYNISRSVRLRSSASAYLNRTPGSAGNRKTWTWSGWVKRGTLGVVSRIFAADDGSASTDQDYNTLLFNSSNQLQFSGNLTDFRITTAVYRDPSAWYHIVFAVDTTQATAANRFRLYVNGAEVTAFGTSNNPTQNTDLAVNAAIGHYIGSIAGSSYVDAYLTEINFIDGQALTPSSFGETDVLTGVWKPKKYTGTYGTNGFFLNFSDNSNNTAATIGKDYSGNGNNWTPNNISVTSGSTYDSMLDVPTQWADGGNGRGNYAVLNPLISSSYQTLTNGNLTSKSNTSTDSGASYSTISTGLTGKWYMEFVADTSAGGGYPVVGTTLETSNLGNANGAAGIPGQNGGGSCGYRSNGQKYISGTSSSYGNSYVTNDVIGVAVDCDNGAVYFSKNGTWQNSGDPTSGATKTGAANTWTGGSTAFYIGVSGYVSGNGAHANFGQRPFSYTPPSGFKALNTLNLPAPTILKGNQYFDATLYTGSTGNTVTVTNSGSMQPDFVWIKNRSTGTGGDHILHDALRGNFSLSSNLTNAEIDQSANWNGFSASGFSVKGSTAQYNNTGNNYVGWQWKEGATQGFDIVTYTGTGSGTTVAHNLGVAPSWVIIKQRSASGNYFVVWARGTTSTSQALWLGATNAVLSTPNYWNSTAPTASVFSVGTDSATNGSGSTYVAYLFSEVAGFSRFGSYTGNGSTDGPFAFCGFRPRYVMIKNASAASQWVVIDSARSPENVTTARLRANTSDAEATETFFDFLSNGFKIRATGTDKNDSGNTYIFAAFSESPFKNSLAR